MFSLYILFKFIHVVAAIAWVGGAATLSVLQMRLARTQDQAVLRTFSKLNDFLGRAFVGPAMLLTLIAGIATAATGGLDFGAFWITWGFIGIVISIALGAIFIRRVGAEVGRLAASATPDPARLATLQGRIALLNGLNTLLLLSVVWTMVFKPVF